MKQTKYFFQSQYEANNIINVYLTKFHYKNDKIPQLWDSLKHKIQKETRKIKNKESALI